MAQSGTVTKQLVRNVYSGTNVTTSAYVTLVAALNGDTNEIDIFDSSGETLVLALGPAGGESDVLFIMPGGNGRGKLILNKDARLSVKAVSADALVGELTMNLLG